MCLMNMFFENTQYIIYYIITIRILDTNFIHVHSVIYLEQDHRYIDILIAFRCRIFVNNAWEVDILISMTSYTWFAILIIYNLVYSYTQYENTGMYWYNTSINIHVIYIIIILLNTLEYDICITICIYE